MSEQNVKTGSFVSRVDYSELVHALLQGDERMANELLRELVPRLKEYLTVVMGATPQEAEESVQQAMVEVIERITEKKIRDSRSIFSYLMKACRHEFLYRRGYEKRFNYDEGLVRNMVEPAEQIQNLLDEERQRILKECLEELDRESRTFILHFIRKPETTTRQASRLFNISGAYVRTRKSRLTARLHDCYKIRSSR